MKLFGNRIDPCCQYCEHGRTSADGQMVLCLHQGVVAPYFSCRKYKYSPLKRVPRKRRPLPKFSKEDFEL